MKKKAGTQTVRNLLLASAVAAGVTGYGLGATNLMTITPSYAEAVKIDAPAAFSFADVVEAVSPAVVSVRVEANFEPANDRGDFDFQDRGRRFFEEFFRNGPRGDFQRPRRKGPQFGQSQGSGFFVSEDGYIVTNNHVIDGGSKFIVITSDGNELAAELVGSDPRTDLAVLKVTSDDEFTYVDFGETRPRIGEWVVAVGNPFGLGGTVTAGIVSAHGREIGASRYDDFIQIDAAVNKGNSGGPAFNLNGEVIGVNTAIFSPSGGNVGIAFAIPAGLANEIVDDLIQNGSVTRGWLGVQIQPVTEEMGEALGLELTQGAIVTSSQDGSPAYEAGIEAGDIITEVDGKAIKGPRALARVIGSYDPNSKVAMTVWRDGEARTVDVTLGNLENASLASGAENGRPTQLKRLGITLETMQDGLTITKVNPGSRAEQRGMRPGDVIVAVNGQDISTFKDLRDQMKSAREAGRKSALLQIQRESESVFIPVPLRRG